MVSLMLTRFGVDVEANCVSYFLTAIYFKSCLEFQFVVRFCIWLLSMFC